MATSTSTNATADRPVDAAAEGPTASNGHGRKQSSRQRKDTPGFELDCGTGADVRHVGIVFVHGIGSQEPGETLLNWGGAIAGLLLDIRLAEKTAGDPVISCDLDPPPTKSRFIELQLPGAAADGQASKPEHWVMTEAWWAQRVRPPPFGKMAEWLGPRGAISRIVLAILPRENGDHDPRRRPMATPYPMRLDATHGPEETADRGHVVGQFLDFDGRPHTKSLVGAFQQVGKASAGLLLQAMSALILARTSVSID